MCVVKGKLKQRAYEAFARWWKRADRYHSTYQCEWPEAWLRGYRAAQRDHLRETLELIAAPKRADGTYNRSREACEKLARDALAADDKRRKGNE